MYVQRVVAGVSGSPGSLQALRYAAEMARWHGATLMPVFAWIPPGGELADRRYPCPQLRVTWQQAARDRLEQAVALGIGGPPDDVEFVPEIACGDPGRVLTEIAGLPGDTLVIGTGRHGAARRIVACKIARYCMAHAACPVVAVPPARLATEAQGLHGWVLRHRLHAQDAELLGTGGWPGRGFRAG